jgi:two-component system OmpR family sensor kinase/two-component system sensor histidine kinase BaeS
MNRWHPRRQPPWWPAGEPWPPAGPYAWRRQRRWIFRPLAFFLIVLVLSTTVGRNLGPAGSAAFLGTAIAGLLIVLAIGGAAIRRVAAPIGDIVDAAHKVAGGDFSVRLSAHGPPTVRAVAGAFNDMAARLQAQERQRRDMLAEIAHELRTPLSIIQGRLEGVLDGVYDRDDRSLAALLDETRLLSRLIDDLRTLAEIESGAFVLAREQFDPAALVYDVAEVYRTEASARHLALHLDIAPDLPAIDGDAARLRQVLSNLITNALRHTDAGGITIAARRAGAALTISVADTGRGIPASDLPHVFDRFYRGNTSRGSGLGLTIARDLVQAHGGTLEAASAPDSGTTMTVTLPVVRPDRAD